VPEPDIVRRESAVPQHQRSSRRRPLFLPTAIVFGACLILGGGTRQGFGTDALLQYASIPLLLLAIWHLAWPTETERVIPPRQARNLIFACGLIWLFPLLQLIPLPPAIWTALPGHESLVTTFKTLGRDLPWHPISVSPQATLESFLSMLPALALFLATCSLGFTDRRHLSILILAIAMLAVFLGLLQVVQGPASPLRFFEYTNVDDAVGFFANRNHQSALLYCATIIAAAWIIALLESITAQEQREGMTPIRMIAILLAVTGMIIFASTQVFTRSRAGVALTMVAFAFALVLGARRSKSTDQSSKLRWIAIGCSVTVVLMAQIALYRVTERFTPDQLADSRAAYARTTFQAARDFLPLGAGVGTFQPVYAAYERREDLVADTYANRAHNDFLEFFLEGGVLGIVFVLPFAILLLVKAIRAWRPAGHGVAEIDVTLQRAASIVLLLLLLHSLVDYPLRTTALFSLFAFSAALIASSPIVRTAHVHHSSHRDQRPPAPQPEAPKPPRKSSITRMDSIPQNPHPSAPHAPRAAPPQGQAPGSGERWGSAVDWPDAWREGTAVPRQPVQPQPPPATPDVTPPEWRRPPKPPQGK
jgi:O-antigen ligase